MGEMPKAEGVKISPMCATQQDIVHTFHPFLSRQFATGQTQAYTQNVSSCKLYKENEK